MKKIILCILIGMPFLVCAQRAKQAGWVTELNSGKAPLAGVQIEYEDAPSTTSDDGGYFRLSFLDKKYGDLIFMRTISKLGYELVNEKELLYPTLSSGKIKVILCKKGMLDQMRTEYYNLSKDALSKGYKEQINKLKLALKEKRIEEKDYFFKIKELQEQLKKSEDKASELAEKYARTNFDDVSEEYKQAFEQFKLGNLDGTVAILEKVNLPKRLKKRFDEKEKIKNLTDKFRTQMVENERGIKQDMQAMRLAADMYNLKMDFEKADEMYTNLVALDSTNVENVMAYGEFSCNYKQYYKSRDLYTSALNISRKKNDLLLVSSCLSNLGTVYNALNNIKKAISCVEESMNIKRRFPRTKSIEMMLAKDYHTMGNSLYKKGNTYKANTLYKKGMRVLSKLDSVKTTKMKIGIYNDLAAIFQKDGFVDNAFDYYNDILRIIHEQKLKETEEGKVFLGIVYKNIGGLYYSLKYYDSSEKYYKKSLVYIDKLAEVNPTIFLPVLAEIKYNLGNGYLGQHRLKEAEEKFRGAIKIYNDLANDIPEAYLPQLANLYQQLAILFREKEDYEKSLALTQKSLKINARMYKWSPDYFLEYIHNNQYNLGVTYLEMKDYDKSNKWLNKAYRSADKLHDKNIIAHGAKPFFVLYSAGLLYKEQGKLDDAIKIFYNLYYNMDPALSRASGKYNMNIAFLLANLGVMYSKKYEFSEAFRYTRDALGYYDYLEKHNSKSFKIERNITYGALAEVYYNKYWFYSKEKDLNKSKSLIDKAINNLKACDEKYSVEGPIAKLEKLRKKIDQKIKVNKAIKRLEKINEEAKKRDSLKNKNV